jgi:hypothetical protein
MTGHGDRPLVINGDRRNAGNITAFSIFAKCKNDTKMRYILVKHHGILFMQKFLHWRLLKFLITKNFHNTNIFRKNVHTKENHAL